MNKENPKCPHCGNEFVVYQRFFSDKIRCWVCDGVIEGGWRDIRFDLSILIHKIIR